MTIKRLSKDDPESYVVMIMYKEARRHPLDGQWRRFDGTVAYRGNKYKITADFVLRDQYFTYKHLNIEEIGREIIRLH